MADRGFRTVDEIVADKEAGTIEAGTDQEDQFIDQEQQEEEEDDDEPDTDSSSSSSSGSGQEFVIRDGEGNVVERTSDPTEVGFDEDFEEGTTTDVETGGMTGKEDQNSTGDSTNAESSAKQDNFRNPIDQLENIDETTGLPENQETVDQIQEARKQTGIERRVNAEITDSLETRETNLETRQNIRESLKQVSSSPENTVFSLNDEKLSREEVEETLQNKEEQVETVLQENQQSFNELVENQKSENPLKGAAPNPVKGANQLLQQDLDQAVEQGLGDFFNPNKQVDRNLDLSEEAVLTGQDIIRQSEEVSEDIAPKIPLEKGLGIAGVVSGPQQVVRGRPVQGVRDFFIPGIQSDLEKQRAKDLERGLIQFPGTLAGWGVGGTGAVVSSIEADIKKGLGNEDTGPGSVEAVLGGGEKVVEQFSENPGRFTAEELGEEIGETAGTALIAGPAAAAATVTPTVEPSITVNTPESLQTADRFITGDLGTRATKTNVVGDIQNTEIIETEFEPRNEGGRRQIVRGKKINDEGEIEGTLLGERVEEPVSRREFLKEKLGLSERELTDFIDSNTLGSGVGAFVPETQSPETDTTPETDFDPNDVFTESEKGSTSTGESRLPDEINIGLTGETPATVNPKLDQRQNINSTAREQGFQEINLGQVLEQTISQRTIPERTTSQELKIDNVLTPEITQTQTPTATTTNTVSNTVTPGFGFGDDKDQPTGVFGEPSVDEDPEATPSLDAIFTGQTTEENIEDETVFTGFETREVTEETDDIFKGLF